jgi:hypothetical protein
MKERARTPSPEPILQDGAASSFGIEGAGLSVKSFRRGNGTLTLTGDALIFDPHVPGARIEVPLDTIERLTVGYWHQYRSSVAPVLKVTYRRNLVLGIVVNRPERWINAIRALRDREGQAVRVDPYTSSRTESRHIRILLSGLILFLFLVGVILPVFFSRVRHETLRNAVPRPEPQALPAAP